MTTSYETLVVLSDALDDIEDLRKRTENRYQALTSETVTGEKGGRFGKGLDKTDPAAQMLAAFRDTVREIERQTVRDLETAMRNHPLGQFAMETRGLGLKSVARFLGSVGPLEERERVSSLLKYCGLDVINPNSAQDVTDNQEDPGAQSTDDNQVTGGAQGPDDNQIHIGAQRSDYEHTSPGAQSRDDNQTTAGAHANSDDQTVHGVAPRRRKGQQAKWNSKARKAAWLMATGAIKAKSDRYKPIYDAARAKYAKAVHYQQCQNSIKPIPGIPQTNGCGTQAHPEQGAPGSSLKPAHQHARAIRAVMKAIVADLWLEATKNKGP